MVRKRSYPRTQSALLTLLLLGDILVCYMGLAAGYYLRFETPLRSVGIESTSVSFQLYQPLLWLGTFFLVLSYSYLKLYDPRLLLRPNRVMSVVMRGTFFWFVAFLGISLTLRFEPNISRIFVAVSCLTTFCAITAWRWGFFWWLSHSPWRERILQRVAYVGWTDESRKLAEAIHADRNHPYDSMGVIVTRPIPENARYFSGLPYLGELDELDAILTRNLIDIVVITDLDLSKQALMRISTLCERRYVAIKLIPSMFQVFVSNLRMQTISGVPILGVEDLPLRSLPNQITKRSMDILGGIVGICLSLPVIAVLAAIIKWQSPGPAIYRQIRTGRNGQPFVILKLRSMRPDAESGTGPQWAVEKDPRRLRIGAFMREWNLDELPQFWNVLIGDMSLVGPRPERPELIAKFEEIVPHYNPRHEVRPGITGWAQVNGLRGNTSLVDRIRYDLYYIENWSFWFDLQIIILTFFRRKNAY